MIPLLRGVRRGRRPCSPFLERQVCMVSVLTLVPCTSNILLISLCPTFGSISILKLIYGQFLVTIWAFLHVLLEFLLSKWWDKFLRLISFSYDWLRTQYFHKSITFKHVVVCKIYILSFVNELMHFSCFITCSSG